MKDKRGLRLGQVGSQGSRERRKGREKGHISKTSTKHLLNLWCGLPRWC